jgi:ATP-binding cassette subfamily F protein uup
VTGQAQARTAAAAARAREAASDAAVPKARVRLSYKEQRELAALPEMIESLEREQAQLTARMSAADYHQQEVAQLRANSKRLEELEAMLLEKFARWEWLEEQGAGSI